MSKTLGAAVQHSVTDQSCCVVQAHFFVTPIQGLLKRPLSVKVRILKHSIQKRNRKGGKKEVRKRRC